MYCKVPLRESLGEIDESQDNIRNNWSYSSSYYPNTDPSKPFIEL
jgi:hypothetical protein